MSYQALHDLLLENFIFENQFSEKYESILHQKLVYFCEFLQNYDMKRFFGRQNAWYSQE